jgi:hypothetical protein
MLNRFSSNSSDCQSGVTVGNSATTGIFASTVTHFSNYSSTTTFKSFMTRSAADRNGAGTTQISINSTNGTAAISNIVIYNDTNANWVAGSTWTLFGIRAA